MYDVSRWATVSMLLVILAASPPVLAKGPSTADGPATWTVLPFKSALPAAAPLLAGDIPLILDDSGSEMVLGFNGANAQQFLWFNRFEKSTAFPLDLQEIQVLFPMSPEVTAGAAVQLVVYSDSDGDPTNGADLLATFNETIQTADGASFSTYPLSPPVRIPAAATDILVGVINRFVTGGSPPSLPAALDTTASAGRSWVALWTGGPLAPDPPVLPADDLMSLVDVIEPGNWMIRASASLPPVLEIPTLGGAGFALLVTFLAVFGVRRLRRLSLPS